jgi:AcrR family transcriptional regulator
MRLGLDERRAQLIELGRVLFNERSYDEISIDDIAAAAGISKGLLYHYFPSKRSFYVETVRAGAEHLTEVTNVGEEYPPAERLDRGLDAYLDYVEANASSYAMLLRSGIGSDAEVAAIVEETRRVLIERLVRGLGVSQPSALLLVALRAWLGFIEGASLEWIDHGGVSRDALRALLFTALESAVTSASGARKSSSVRPPQGPPAVESTKVVRAPTGGRRTMASDKR